MDAVFEVSSGPTEAVSALAGMFPPEAEVAPANNSSSTGDEEGADRPAASTAQEAAAAAAAADAVLLANKRHARALEDIQAQRGPTASPTEAALATPAVEEGDAESPQEDGAESPDAEAEPEVEVGSPAGGVDASGGSSKAELEKVAAFIASYAGAHFGRRDPPRICTRDCSELLPFLAPACRK